MTRLDPDDDEHLRTGDERLQTQSQQPGRWAGIRRINGFEKGGVKHNRPSVEGLNRSLGSLRHFFSQICTKRGVIGLLQSEEETKKENS